MPVSHEDMRLLVGEHRGILRAVKREISELKRSFDAVQADMRELRSAFDTRLPEIEQRLDKIDDRCARHHPLNAPGHESIGTFFARAGLKALEIFAVAAALGALYVLASLAGVAP